jgi:SulP family sulfate permease
VSTVLDRIGEHPRVFILDFAAVPMIDSTASRALHGFVHKLQRSGTKIYVSGASSTVRRTLINAGLKPPAVLYSDSVESARVAARECSG